MSKPSRNDAQQTRRQRLGNYWEVDDDDEDKTCYVYCGGRVDEDDKKNIKHVRVASPSSVDGDGDEAVLVTKIEGFRNCENLTSVDIPSSVQDIMSGAFSCCINLKSIELPDSIKYIGIYAFNESGLTSIKLPKSLRTLTMQAFYKCQSIQHIDFGSVEKIEQSAFYQCSALTRITVPTSVQKLEQASFQACTGLTCVDFEQNSSMDEISKELFSLCSSLTSIDLPKSIRRIGKRSFAGCTGLAHLRLPPMLNAIGLYAFENCTGLETIDFPVPLVRIKQGAFYGCSEFQIIALGISLSSTSSSTRNDANKIVPASNKSLQYLCDVNRGGNKFFVEQNLGQKDCPSSLWPYIFYRILYEMALPKETHFSRQDKDDGYTQNDLVRRHSVIFYMLVNGALF